MVITSTQNGLIQETRKLLDKKERIASGLYVVEGEKIIFDAHRYGTQFEYIIATEECAQKYSAFGCPVHVASERVVNTVCDSVSPQGAAAVIRQAPPKPFVKTAKSLLFDCVRDPGNVGAILRSAAAFGYQNVLLTSSADVYSPKVLRAASSAHFCLNIYEFDQAEPALALLCGNAIELIGADMNGEDATHFAPGGSFALVIGNEGCGISPTVRAACSRFVALKMENNFESLNAAVAASVLMHALSAKRN